MVSQALIQQAVIDSTNELRERTTAKLSDAFLRSQAEPVVMGALRLAEASEKRRRETTLLPCGERHKARLMVQLSSADISRETAEKIIAEITAEEGS